MTGLYEDDNDGAGYPLFTFVDENTFKKETFLGKLQNHCHLTWFESKASYLSSCWGSLQLGNASYTTALWENKCLNWHDFFTHSTALFASLILSSLSPPFRVKRFYFLIISLWRTVRCCISAEHAEFTVLAADRCSSTTTGFSFRSSSALNYWSTLPSGNFCLVRISQIYVV